MAHSKTGQPLFVRNAPKVQTPDVELEPATKYQLIALARIERVMQAIARQIASVIRPVDEYSIVGGYVGDSVATVEVQAQFDQLNEMIESVLVTGPASTAFTLQLGDRNWSLTTTANGFAVLAPVKIMLSRSDRRLLTGASAGNWTLELMGHADVRY